MAQLRSGMDKAVSDRLSETEEREQMEKARADELDKKLAEMLDETRIRNEETAKERERLTTALREAEQRLADLAQRQETASATLESSSSAMLEHQLQMDAIRSKMSHLEKTNAELVSKCDALQKENDGSKIKEASFSETMGKGKFKACAAWFLVGSKRTALYS